MIEWKSKSIGLILTPLYPLIGKVKNIDLYSISISHGIGNISYKLVRLSDNKVIGIGFYIDRLKIEALQDYRKEKINNILNAGNC